MSEMDTLMAQWRTGVVAKLEELEAREAAERAAEQRAADKQDGGRDDEIPPDAPPAYRRVQVRVERGELDWPGVIAGDSEDADVRAVHLWLSARLEPVRRAFGAVTADMTVEQARAAVESALGTTDGAARRRRAGEE
jgi:hypothetical protein